MNRSRILFPAVALAGLAACQPETAGIAGDTSPTVATVNGVPISWNFYRFYVKDITGGKTPADLTPEQRSAALDNLILAHREAEEAEKEGLDKSGDAPYLLELSRLKLLAGTVQDQFLKGMKPTDQELLAAYQKWVSVNNTAYHARDILVATEPSAEKVIQRLENGEKFDVLAEEESIDRSKNNGGDLGWFTLNEILPEFHTPLMALRPSEFTHKPVQTQNGWSVIQLIDTRPVIPPPFEEIRQQLEKSVQAQKFHLYTQILMNEVKVRRSRQDLLNLPATDAPPAPTAASGASAALPLAGPCLAGTACRLANPNPDELPPRSDGERMAPCAPGTDCRFHFPKPNELPPMSEEAQRELPQLSEAAEMSTSDEALGKFAPKSPARTQGARTARGTTSAPTATTPPPKN